MKRSEIISKTTELALPICADAGVELWDVEFVKEGATMVLRLLLTKESGISINDCERVSRAIDPLLDEYDYIDTSYCLEVSSAGLDRKLTRPEHFDFAMGKKVTVRLFAPDSKGRKEYTGILSEYDEGDVTVDIGKETGLFEKKNIASVHLFEEI